MGGGGGGVQVCIMQRALIRHTIQFVRKDKTKQVDAVLRDHKAGRKADGVGSPGE